MPPIRPFDVRALTEPVDPAAAKAFTARLRNDGAIRDGGTVVTVIVMVFLGLFAFVFAAIALSVLVAFATVLREGAAPLGILLMLPLVLCVGGIVAIVVVGARTARRQEERRWRLARFSEAVGMQYVPSISAPPLPGSVFQVGGSRTSADVLRGHQPRFVEVGNYQYTVSNGKNQTTVRFGYIAIKLSVPLPHIVLDATANSITLGSFRRDQHLSLEGDFDRYFRLYCPEGYERDALYLFTPDVMARFVDNAAVFDVEIVDDWLFLYSSGEMSTTDPGRWAWTFSLIAALLDKLDQWERWRDERLRPGGAAGAFGASNALGASGAAGAAGAVGAVGGAGPAGAVGGAEPASGAEPAGGAGPEVPGGSAAPGVSGASGPGTGSGDAAPWAPGPVGAGTPESRMPTAVASTPVPIAPLPLSAPPGVAPPGRRLRRGVPWVALAIIGVVLTVGIVGVVGMVLLPLLFMR